MDARISGLKYTTFSGQRLTRRTIAEIQETVELLPLLSRTELAQTVCAHRDWRTPRGRNRLQLAMRVLEGLEREGIVTLSEKRHDGPGPNRPIRLGAGSDPQPPINGPLSALQPVRLETVTAQPGIAEW